MNVETTTTTTSTIHPAAATGEEGSSTASNTTTTTTTAIQNDQEEGPIVALESSTATSCSVPAAAPAASEVVSDHENDDIASSTASATNDDHDTSSSSPIKATTPTTVAEKTEANNTTTAEVLLLVSEEEEGDEQNDENEEDTKDSTSLSHQTFSVDDIDKSETTNSTSSSTSTTTNKESSSSSSLWAALKVDDDDQNDNKKKDQRPLRILFLSDVTGGGHLASAEALGKQFRIQFPGSTVDICNLWTEVGDRVARGIVQSYKHMSARPWQWQLFYHVSNTKAVELLGKNHSRIFCASNVKARIAEFQPDAVISVHPTMNHLARIQTKLLGEELGKHIPFYTVVTDLGSAHGSWFEPEVNKIYVASPALVELAKQKHRGRILDSNICLTGLPIRHGFAMQAERLQNDRTSTAGRVYQRTIKDQLSIDTKQMILVMGGGEGVGSLSDIVNQLYVTCTFKGGSLDVTICVVCGRNETLQNDLETRDWVSVMEQAVAERDKRRRRLQSYQKMMAKTPTNFCSPDTILLCDNYGRDDDDDDDNDNNDKKEDPSLFVGESSQPSYNKKSPSPMMQRLMTKFPRLAERQPSPLPLSEGEEGGGGGGRAGNVKVVGLGFVTNMEEYMVAADILVSKAGPGTIAEAAAVGLPVMLTSYLPGQEAGNVDVVLEAGFGSYCEDPIEIAARVSAWLQDEEKLVDMSRAATQAGNPHAARDIVQDIGSETVTWMKLNERWKDDPIYKSVIRQGHKLDLKKNGDDLSEFAALYPSSAVDERDPKANSSTTKQWATAAGVGVGAAVGAVVAGPLLPIGLAVGGAIIPALPVGLAVGGTVSGFAANKLAGRSSIMAAPAAATTAGVEGEEAEQGEEKDDEARRWFVWRGGAAETDNNKDGTVADVDANAIDSPDSETIGNNNNRSSWFGWASSGKEDPATLEEKEVAAKVAAAVASLEAEVAASGVSFEAEEGVETSIPSFAPQEPTI